MKNEADQLWESYGGMLIAFRHLFFWWEPGFVNDSVVCGRSDPVDRFLIDELALEVKVQWVAGTDVKSAPTLAMWARGAARCIEWANLPDKRHRLLGFS